MKMTKQLTLGAVAIALALGGAAHVSAQPGKERRDARKERRDDRKERRDERRDELKEKRDDLKEKRDELKEKRDELKEKREELREQFKAKRERRKELKEKEKSGELTAEEKEELAKLEEGYEKRQKRHEELKAKHAELKETRKERRLAARRKLHEEYPNFHKHPAAVAEFKKHARRMAHLHRAKQVAQADERAGMEEKVDELIKAEQARHDAWVAKHKAAWAAKNAAKAEEAK